MKKTIPCRLAAFGTALILSALAAFPAFAASHSGHLDSVSDKTISGWAWDSASPNTSVTVELTISGTSLGPIGSKPFTVSADQFRSDLQLFKQPCTFSIDSASMHQHRPRLELCPPEQHIEFVAFAVGQLPTAAIPDIGHIRPMDHPRQLHSSGKGTEF